GSRGRAAPAAARTGAALPQPGAAKGGDREPREPGRRLHAPPASAARPGFAPPGRVGPRRRCAQRLATPSDRRAGGSGVVGGLRPVPPSAVVAPRDQGGGRAGEREPGPMDGGPRDRGGGGGAGGAPPERAR